MGKTNSQILIVDDDVEVYDLLFRILKSMGYENIKIATTGKDAVVKVMAEKPDLVLLDLGLPEIDGAAVLRRIKNIYENIPVIVITAFPDSDIAKEARKQGVSDFIAKPFDVNDLKQRIIKVLEASP